MSSRLVTGAALVAAFVGGVAVSKLLKCKKSGSCSSRSSCGAATGEPKKPKVVVVTGAAGQIGYSIVFLIAQGKMLGDDQPVELRLLDLPQMESTLKGVHMELQDCAYPLLAKVVATSNYQEAFTDADVALLIGARPRGPGMDRRDLLKANASIFEGQGAALNKYASRDVKVLVVGNPANTNARIAMHFAPSLPKSAFTAMTRLDQNRATALLAERTSNNVTAVRNVVIWGNHSNTQYPDISHATINNQSVSRVINDDSWLHGEFITKVQSRGGEIINALKKSSAASAANAAVEHVRDWVLGTGPDRWVSMGVVSDGSYGIRAGLIYSFPCTCVNGNYSIVNGLAIDSFSTEKMKTSEKELIEEEREALPAV